MSYNPNKYPRWDNGRGRGPPANDANDNSREGFNRRNDGDRSNHQSGSRGQEYRDRNQGDCRYGGDANIKEPWMQRYQGPPAASNQARTDHASGHYGSRHGQDGVVVAHSAALVDKHTYALTKSAAAHVYTTIFPVQTLEEWKTLPLREKLKSQIPQNNQNLIRSIPQEWYEKNPDLNACPGDLIDTPLMDLKMKAAERTLAAKIKEFDNIIATQTSIKDASGSECESEDSLPMGGGPWPAAQWENISKQQLTSFVQALPHFLLLNLVLKISDRARAILLCRGVTWMIRTRTSAQHTLT